MPASMLHVSILIFTAICPPGKFMGKVPKVVPVDFDSAVNGLYELFSERQIKELKQKPYIVEGYNIPDWVLANWLLEGSILKRWFKLHGVDKDEYSAMMLFRALQCRLNESKFEWDIELNRIKNKKPLPPIPR